MIARKVHSLTKEKNTMVMIARKVHSLTKTKNKSHDCTKRSFIDQSTKNETNIGGPMHQQIQLHSSEHTRGPKQNETESD